MSRVSFETNAYGEPIGRTRSGQQYSQSPEILDRRYAAKSINKDSLVLNPQLAATTPFINGERDPGWTTNDPIYYQNKSEKKNAVQQKGYETPLYGDTKWTANNAGTRGYFTEQRYYGGKKTKRKISRRSKKSRRHRKK